MGLNTKTASQIDQLRASEGASSIQAAQWSAERVARIRYPVCRYPEKIKAVNLDRDGGIEGLVTGIKGQYLMFSNKVLNIRNYAGYQVELSVSR